MPTIYNECGSDVYKLANTLIRQYFGQLEDVGVSFHIRFAENENGNAVKHNGYPAYAVIRSNSYSDRQQGKKDCTLTIDKVAWDGFSDIQQESLIAHELNHCELKFDKDGNVKRDDLDRPKVKMRKHDWVYGGFDSMVARYGTDSIEFAQVQKLVNQWTELGWWPNNVQEEKK